jgi:hypothetical protein
LSFELLLAALSHFAWFATFHDICWFCGFSFFYMTFLSFSLALGLLTVLHVSWIRNSNFVLLCCQCTHQGGY